MSISGRTRVVAIIGDPVDHSLSPVMHNAAFAALDLDYVYVAMRVASRALPQALKGLCALGIAGVNVTVPHKERVLPWLDSISPMARRIGAVNTIVQRDGLLHGENTDVVGVSRTLKSSSVRLRGAEAIVVGAGGSARAVVAALIAGGASRIRIANRTPSRARVLARRFVGQGAELSVLPLGGLCDESVLSRAVVVVNATSIGLSDEQFPSLDYSATPPRCLFFDVIYGHQTDFLTRAWAAGRSGVDGADMLMHQGAAAFRLWTGRHAPIDVMRAALVPDRRPGKKHR